MKVYHLKLSLDPSSLATKLLYLDRMLKDVETKFRAMLPHEEGLLLRPVLITHSAKKISQKYKKLHQRSLNYSSLALDSKAYHKKDWRFRNRVGSMALRQKGRDIIKILTCILHAYF